MRPYQQRAQERRKRLLKKKPLLLALLLVVIIAGAITALELTNKTHWFHKNTYSTAANKPGRTLNADTKGETSPDKSPPAQPTQSPPADKDKGSGGSTGENLKVPTGNFVSNHHPNLGSKPAPNEIQSVCITTSGASCQIIFTKDGVSKSLPAQTTDRGGAAYWTWKLQDIGLTTGSWKVQATATLGTQTQTANDALTLEVSP